MIYLLIILFLINWKSEIWAWYKYIIVVDNFMITVNSVFVIDFILRMFKGFVLLKMIQFLIHIKICSLFEYFKTINSTNKTIFHFWNMIGKHYKYIFSITRLNFNVVEIIKMYLKRSNKYILKKLNQILSISNLKKIRIIPSF